MLRFSNIPCVTMNCPSQEKNGALTLLLLVALLGLALTSCAQATPPPAGPSENGVSVTVDRSAPLTTSQFSLGITHVDNSLDYPWNNNNPAAVQSAAALIKQGLSFENTAIMAWGAPDPWPDPSQAEPSNWGYLDNRLQMILKTGGVPVLTLSEAPWWMKGELEPDGTTRLLRASDEWSNVAYNSRILDNKMGAWLHLVQRVAQRYMAPPYNVRYFQVWNELKGYYDPVTNAYDYTTSQGEPGGSNARHGYTFMYNQVYDSLTQVAGSLGIPAGSVKIGGPYVVMATWSSSNQSNPSNISKAYGTYDQRSFDVVLYWLEHKAGAGFITLDAHNINKNPVNPADPFVGAEKFADIVTWLRSLDSTRYAGATTLPVWFAEWYATSYSDTPDNQYNDAIKSYAMIKFIQAGGAVALAWGGMGDGQSDTGMWSSTSTPGGGKALPWYNSARAFKDYFPAGTRIYKTVVSAPQSVAALASAQHIMLVNKTAASLSVSVDGSVVALSRYQVRVIA